MTSHELARLLLAGPDVPVIMEAYECGYQDVLAPRWVQASLNCRVDDAYRGPHEIVYEGTETWWSPDPVDVVYLPSF